MPKETVAQLSDDDTFTCTCGHRSPRSVYLTAQLASNVSLRYTCTACGAHWQLKGRAARKQRKRTK